MNPEDILPPESPQPVPPDPQTAVLPSLPEQPEPQGPPSPLPDAGPETRVSNTLPVMEPGERMICSIHRHPIGILGVYVMCGLILIITAILAFIVAPHISSNSTSKVILAGTLVFMVVAVACAAFALIAAKVYWGNSWTLTTDSITQVNQVSLFKRQSGQLALDNLEDVTAEQNGLLAHMFNYGVLRVETAGESSKFIFPFCPNPNYYAQKALAAREAFEQNRRGEA